MNVQKRMVTRKSLPAEGIGCKESRSDIKAIYQLILTSENRAKIKKSHLLRETKNKI